MRTFTDTPSTSHRTLIAALFAVLLSPLASFAQQPAKTVRIGFLGTQSASGYASEISAIRTGLRDFGYVEGRNLVIEYRWAEGDGERLRELARELAALNVDVLITHSIPGARAAMNATKSIPIVLADVVDPVTAGLVASLARPGGNVTGSTSFQFGVHAKRLELLAEVVPGLARVGHLVNARNTEALALYRKTMAEATRAMKVELLEFAINGVDELPAAFAAMTKQRVDAVLVGEEPMINANAPAVAALAVTHRLPAAGFTHFGAAGGLLGYGADRTAVYARSAYFVDRIVKGARPGDIPMEGATKFELIVNLRTAKALGIRIPQPLLQRADRAIE
jgi:putative ABC transport system substrate-binding protein